MIQDFHDDKVVPYHRENQEKLAKLQLTQAVWSGGLAVLIFLMPLIWHWLGVK